MTEVERWSWRQSPPVILCERTGQWAVWWRSLAEKMPGPGCPRMVGPRMVEVRSVVECCRELAESPAAFVVLELSEANADAVVDLLADQEWRWPLAAMVVVAGREMTAWEPLVRNAGALGWSTSPRRLRPLVEMAQRHAERRSQPYETLNEAIQAALPWRPTNE